MIVNVYLSDIDGTVLKVILHLVEVRFIVALVYTLLVLSNNWAIPIEFKLCVNVNVLVLPSPLNVVWYLLFLVSVSIFKFLLFKFKFPISNDRNRSCFRRVSFFSSSW